MTSLHWVELLFLVAPPPAEAELLESRCSAISSEMKVFRSTSWRPLRLARQAGTRWRSRRRRRRCCFRSRAWATLGRRSAR
ncbi:unnamed protein product [Tetraodon nigroviridis]|uniref:(spotted green pufferfish) hypothetical protein n=1 Tax=Tetraodon nigroviridis TaxID=99883 RepID=Q4TDY8_TETNG|nr:unnamed protein product [Tetraodon nigroviridis]